MNTSSGLQSLNTISNSSLPQANGKDYQDVNNSKDFQGGMVKGKINLRHSFISPELAYSNDRRRFQEKLGYTKGQSSFKASSYTDVKQNLFQQQPIDHQAQILKYSVPKQDETMFMRRKAKADDSYYEKRVQTISQIRNRKRLNESCDSNTNKQGILKRLMTMRKQKQQCQDSYFEKEESSPIPSKGNVNRNYSLAKNTTSIAHQYKGSLCEPHQVSDPQSSLEYDRKDFTEQMQKSQFMAKRKNRTSQKFKHSRMLLDMHKDNQQSRAAHNDIAKDKSIDTKDAKSRAMFSNKFDINETVMDFKEKSFLEQVSSLREGNKASQLSKIKINRNLVALNSCQYVPAIQGISKQQLLDLYQAKCQDLGINASKDQMVRFFETICKNMKANPRKLNLVDMSFGDSCLDVIGNIIKNNPNFSVLDLSKNHISCNAIQRFVKALQLNHSIVYLNLGCNQISTEGAAKLFQGLKNQDSIVSLCLANADCYKNKNKIGKKAAVALEQLLKQNQILQILDLSDNSISSEGFSHVISGIKCAKNLISVNLTQNDIGSNPSSFNQLLSIFEPCKTVDNQVKCYQLEELILNQNLLSNKNIEDLASTLQNCQKSKLQRIYLSQNKVNYKAFFAMIQALKNNQKLKLSHLIMDKCTFQLGQQQEQASGHQTLQKLIADYFRSSRSSLTYLSLSNCGIGNEVMRAIGRGLQMNEKLDTLLLKGNKIDEHGLVDMYEAFKTNKELKLRVLDLSSNRLSDSCGIRLASALRHAESLEQVNLRDNSFGIESGDHFQFLVQQKQNLWKLQLDLNTIKYASLMEIDKFCKRNRRNAKVMYIPSIQQEINNYRGKKEPNAKIEEMDRQIDYQQKVIREGFTSVVNEEEYVHSIIEDGHSQIRKIDKKKQTLADILEKQDEFLQELDLQIKQHEREQSKKVEEEESLLERYRDYIRKQEEKLHQEQSKVEKRKEQKLVNEEKAKLQDELEKVNRDNQMMKLIIDSYEKEIERRQKTLQSNEACNDECEKPEQQPHFALGLGLAKCQTDEEKETKVKAEKPRKLSRKRDESRESNRNKRKKSNNRAVRMVFDMS